MRRIKQTTSMLIVLGVIMMGVSNAQAGIIVHDVTSDNEPCIERTENKQSEKVDHGIIVHDLFELGTAILESIFGRSDSPTNCGIIVHD